MDSTNELLRLTLELWDLANDMREIEPPYIGPKSKGERLEEFKEKRAKLEKLLVGVEGGELPDGHMLKDD